MRARRPRRRSPPRVLRMRRRRSPVPFTVFVAATSACITPKVPPKESGAGVVDSSAFVLGLFPLDDCDGPRRWWARSPGRAGFVSGVCPRGGAALLHASHGGARLGAVGMDSAARWPGGSSILAGGGVNAGCASAVDGRACAGGVDGGLHRRDGGRACTVGRVGGVGRPSGRAGSAHHNAHEPGSALPAAGWSSRRAERPAGGAGVCLPFGRQSNRHWPRMDRRGPSARCGQDARAPRICSTPPPEEPGSGPWGWIRRRRGRASSIFAGGGVDAGCAGAVDGRLAPQGWMGGARPDLRSVMLDT